MKRRSASAQAAAASIRRHLRAGGPAQQPRPVTTGLESCAVCGTDFVNPLEWEAVGEESWWMHLRCGECGVTREVTVSNAVAERYDRELNERARPIEQAARRLDLERMKVAVETLIVALQRDLIDASDFARWAPAS